MLLLKIMFAHCMGDYLFRTKSIDQQKDNLMILTMHCILYTSAVYLIFNNSINTVCYYIIIISHFVIDYVKAKGYSVKWCKNNYNIALLIDQIIHAITLLVCVLF